MINGKIKFITADSEIQKRLLEACEKEIKLILDKAKTKIKANLTNIVIEALQRSPEISSLSNGKLKYDFGLNFDPTDSIIYSIANSIDIRFKNFTLRGFTKGIVTAYIQPVDFSNLLGEDFAQVVTDKGQSLPWLQWLLTEGDSIIIADYHVDYGLYPTSRSGGAIMKPGRIYKVDSSFSGTAENNFITRALDKYENQIKEAITRNL